MSRAGHNQRRDHPDVVVAVQGGINLHPDRLVLFAEFEYRRGRPAHVVIQQPPDRRRDTETPCILEHGQQPLTGNTETHKVNGRKRTALSLP